MQTIENSLLQVSVDENSAGLAHVISKNNNFDYLTSGATQEKEAISFPEIDRENNWINKLPWTVVDKGDARVSLTLIDTADSYKKFPYHFEIMITYAIEGNQLNITLQAKNNSNKEMPFASILTLPQVLPAKQQELNSAVFADEEHELKLESTDFKIEAKNGQVKLESNKVNLVSETEQDFNLNFTIV